MKAAKGALKFLLGLGIMFCAIALVISIFTHVTMLNSNFYVNSLNKSNYFTYLRQEIDYSFKNYSLTTSIPEKVFAGAVSDEAIKTLTTDNINNTMDYMKYKKSYVDEKIDTSGFDTGIKTYASGSGADSSQLATATAEASTIVNSHAILFDLSLVTKYKEFQAFRKVIFTIYDKLYVMIAAFSALVLLLFLLSRKSFGTFSLWLGGSLLAASMVILIPGLMALIFNVPYRFAVDNYYLKVALSSITLGYIKYLLISGALLLAAGATLLYRGINEGEAL